jgi:endonuclease/exonuclease/phosphatase family metal-dependent hydrolase
MMLFLLLSSFLTLVELNCENLFDCRHDSLKNDLEFTPDGDRHWNRTQYWNKLNRIGKEILSSSDNLPDLVALCEIENDTVMRDLSRRSLLRHAGYEYLMTESSDLRGIDVALLYQPTRFRPLCYECITVPTLADMRPTRDILYIKGIYQQLDTLHLFILHAPSRFGGEPRTRPFRQQVVNTLLKVLTPLRHQHVIVTGDFNDYAENAAPQLLEQHDVVNISKSAKGKNGTAQGTYCFQGEWHSIDHIFLSPSLIPLVSEVYINDAPFLLEDDPLYGGRRPRRSFNGYRYQKDGFSDHLPLVLKLKN